MTLPNLTLVIDNPKAVSIRSDGQAEVTTTFESYMRGLDVMTEMLPDDVIAQLVEGLHGTRIAQAIAAQETADAGWVKRLKKWKRYFE